MTLASSPPGFPPPDRRRFLRGSAAAGGLGLLGLAGCASAVGPGAPGARTAAGLPIYDAVPPLAPVRAHADRLFDITVCLRPFRAAGPRLDTEMVGDTLVVHNYGHGGSGWSLSWGSSTIAVRKAMAASPKSVAVIGCGALGLTSATLAQRAGAQVTIYARDQLPQTRSSRATGSWTPDSRIALTDAAGPAFGALWEEMARTSFKIYRQYLGLPGTPVEWTDRYTLSDIPPDQARAKSQALNTLGFAEYHDRIADLTPRPQTMPPGSTPFPTPYVERSESMLFNIADYGHTLMNDFLIAGGRFERAEFHAPAEIAALKEKVVINCPGYGGRALWKDESIIPVRGQIAWLIPQPEVRYGFYYKDVSMLSRRDGIVVQALEGGDLKGYKDDNETIDRAEADKAVAVIAELYSRVAAAAG
jgi:glycine/D-amino acid oxidase-like deaminating enzyme